VRLMGFLFVKTVNPLGQAVLTVKRLGTITLIFLYPRAFLYGTLIFTLSSFHFAKKTAAIFIAQCSTDLGKRRDRASSASNDRVKILGTNLVILYFYSFIVTLSQIPQDICIPGIL
jgi:hypothetical protein